MKLDKAPNVRFVYILYFKGIMYDIYESSEAAIDAKDSFVFHPESSFEEADPLNYRVVPWSVKVYG